VVCGERDEQRRGAERIGDRQQRADGQRDRVEEDFDRRSPPGANAVALAT
jgi:hypothetical protein